MARVWKRKASPKTGTGKQAHPCLGAALKKNNPMRERVSFVETVARERKKTFIVEALTTPGVHQSKSSDEDEGRIAVDCQRAITCRVCGSTGHKGRDCLRRGSSHHHDKGEERRAPPVDTRREKPPTHGKEQYQKRYPAMAEKKQHRNEAPAVEKKQHYDDAPAARKFEQHHVSLALDNNMMLGKEEMKSYTVATITAIRGGYVTGAKVLVALKEGRGDWQWPAKEFRDGRYIISCKSTADARELEPKEIHLPAFSLKCEP
ncbi:hypothetical protein J5N97_001338 [Dioscorea zingiberensis]|uniref:CCHC-type domain-containing protein n=1 Tax=Dioscorea zingiberensis TaxID=325984 RepID=A0A9D5BTU4_9LILI|nr:hypothetical protein J5N97_001338 [Dioscorea zingiberensis]